MIWLEIIIVIGLVILLVAMLRDKKKHPEDYQVPKRRKKRRAHKQINKGPGLPWMGGKKFRNR